MSSATDPVATETSRAETLPQLDATSLVDGERLEAEVKAMYRHVARGDDAELHFDVGRTVAAALGYPRALLDAIPDEALGVLRRSRGTTSTSPRCSPARRCSISARDRAPICSARLRWWVSAGG